jgi:molybdopterin synthase catalytic subunit
MTLDHYSGMCESEIAAHAEEARKRWPILALRIVHRTGELVPGDRIVFVGVASVHRQAAFQAAEFLMDYLKTRAPFWKLERRGAQAAWVEARVEDDESVKRWQQPR